ncbi:MAG: LysR family transcriptional regulator [Actinomycetota bacterium]
MEWTARQLRAVVTIAERANISHAAVELGLTQPTVSRMLSRIESDLGHPLFERSQTGATPTEAGVRFVAAANDVLQALEEVSDEIRSLDGRLVGKICVAMPDTIGHTLFIPLIDRFATAHPDVELRVMALHPNSVPRAVRDGDADIGVISSAHRGERMVATPLVDEELQLVGPGPTSAASRDLPPIPAGPITVDRLSTYPLVLPAIQPGLRALIDAAFGQRQLRPDVVLEVDAEDAIIELVGSGRAFSIMSFAGVQRFVAEGRLAACPIVDPSISRQLLTARPDNRATTRLMSAVESAIQDLAAELAGRVHWSPCPG